jgi:hypothetical protein
MPSGLWLSNSETLTPATIGPGTGADTELLNQSSRGRRKISRNISKEFFNNDISSVLLWPLHLTA